MFDENSQIVRLWVDQLLDGRRNAEEVPGLSNLREVVLEQYEKAKK